MGIITSIKQQKRQNRVNVYLDGEFSFGIDLDSFVLLNLRVGQTLTEEEIEKAKNTSDFQKSLEKVYRFAMVRPRSEKEFTDYFRRKNFDESIHKSLITKLESLNLLDDLEFAKAWVQSRLKKKSLKVVKLELQFKGIDRNIIEDVLSETPVDEEKLAKSLLEKKMYKWQNLEPRLKKQKMSQYLAGKGFGWDTIEKVVSKML